MLIALVSKISTVVSEGLVIGETPAISSSVIAILLNVMSVEPKVF